MIFDEACKQFQSVQIRDSAMSINSEILWKRLNYKAINTFSKYGPADAKLWTVPIVFSWRFYILVYFCNLWSLLRAVPMNSKVYFPRYLRS